MTGSRNHGKWHRKRRSRGANVGRSGLPPEKKPKPDDIDALIEASSLGTPTAKAFRDSVSDEDVDRIMDRIEQLGPLDEHRGQ